MTLNVFNIGDGIIHHKPKGENQGKQGDPVDGVSEQIIDEKGQGKADGNGHGNDEGLLPPQGESKKHHNRCHGKEKGAQKPPHLFLGRGPIISRDFPMNSLGNQLGFKGLEGINDILGHLYRVGAFFLGNGKDYGCIFFFRVNTRQFPGIVVGK